MHKSQLKQGRDLPRQPSPSMCKKPSLQLAQSVLSGPLQEPRHPGWHAATQILSQNNCQSHRPVKPNQVPTKSHKQNSVTSLDHVRNYSDFPWKWSKLFCDSSQMQELHCVSKNCITSVFAI